MNFNSWSFVAFFLIVYAMTAPLRRYSELHKWLLLLASWYFYASWDWRYLGLILFSTVFDYWIGLRFADVVNRRRLIAFSVAVNLGVLALFKYANFLIFSANGAASLIGSNVHFDSIDILLPVGISFYTFQSMSYTIDVYRGDLPPRRSLLDYALFIAFFPQLVAGPIVRASEFFRELDNPRRMPEKEIAYALTLIVFGYVKKVVFADNLAAQADPIWNDLVAADPCAVLVAIYAFAFQIYFDFSGYTDIAIGVAMLMGFRFPQNFNYPYVATTLQDFWRRWHMTLSRWLRDYLYIALGGNRKGLTRTHANLLLTMLLGGLWHGASWNFVVWGGIHGVWLAVERTVLSRWSLWRSERPALKLLRWFVTFHIVCFAWIFFRAPDFASSWIVLEKLSSLLRGATCSDWSAMIKMLFVFMMLHALADRYRIKYRVGTGGLWVHASMTFCCLMLIILFVPDQSSPFIYFRF